MSRRAGQLALALFATSASACSAIWGFERPVEESALVPRDDAHATIDAIEEPGIDAAAEEAAPPPTYDPATIPGLVLWVDGARGITGTSSVSRWKDQSGLGNDLVNTDGTSQPSIGTIGSGAAPLPAIHFTAIQGQNLYAKDSPSLQFGMGDFAIVCVVQHRVTVTGRDFDGYGVLYLKVAQQTRPYPGASLFANFPLPTHSSKIGGQVDVDRYVQSTSDLYNDGKPHVLLLRRLGRVLELRVDRASTTTDVDIINVDAVGAPVFVGAHPHDGFTEQRLEGEIGEYLVVKGKLADAEMTALETHLATKYGIP